MSHMAMPKALTTMYTTFINTCVSFTSSQISYTSHIYSQFQTYVKIQSNNSITINYSRQTFETICHTVLPMWYCLTTMVLSHTGTYHFPYAGIIMVVHVLLWYYVTHRQVLCHGYCFMFCTCGNPVTHSGYPMSVSLTWVLLCWHDDLSYYNGWSVKFHSHSHSCQLTI